MNVMVDQNTPIQPVIDSLVSIQMELKAPKDKTNTFGKYKYRSCESILEAVKPLLAKYNCKLTLTDESKELCGVPVIIAIAEFIDSFGNKTIVRSEAGVELNKKGMDVAQTFGASSSYARKYALNGLFLIDDTKDADSDEFNQQSQNAPDFRRQNQAQQPAQKPIATEAECQQALADISNAQSKADLKKPYNYFKETQFAQLIHNACEAKIDQMGWQ